LNENGRNGRDISEPSKPARRRKSKSLAFRLPYGTLVLPHVIVVEYPTTGRSQSKKRRPRQLLQQRQALVLSKWPTRRARWWCLSTLLWTNICPTAPTALRCRQKFSRNYSTSIRLIQASQKKFHRSVWGVERRCSRAYSPTHLVSLRLLPFLPQSYHPPRHPCHSHYTRHSRQFLLQPFLPHPPAPPAICQHLTLIITLQNNLQCRWSSAKPFRRRLLRHVFLSREISEHTRTLASCQTFPSSSSLTR